MPFSVTDLKQIKQDLRKFSEDLDKYIEVFRGLTQSSDLTWKDVMLLLNQTLSVSEREAAVQGPGIFGDEQCLIH